MIVLKNRFGRLSQHRFQMAPGSFICVVKNVLIETLKLILFFLSFSFGSIMSLGVGIAIYGVLCLWMLCTLIGSSVGK